MVNRIEHFAIENMIYQTISSAMTIECLIDRYKDNKTSLIRKEV